MKKFILLISILALALGLYAAPLNEGFESATCPADGWTINYANPSYPSGNAMTHSTTYFHSGSRSFRFSSYSSGSPYDQYLITPELNVTEGDQTVSFWYRNSNAYAEEFRVGWSSTGTATTDFTWSADISNESTAWQQYIKTDLPVGTKYVAVHYFSNYMYYLHIDDFAGPEVYVAPVPPNPAIIAFPANAATNVGVAPTLSWTSGGGFPTGYDVYFGTTLPAEGNPTVSHTTQTTTSWAPGALPYSTTYSWKIVPWNDYGSAGFATCPTWTFTTMADPTVTSFPWTEGFESVTVPALPNGWSMIDNNADADAWVTSTTYPNTGTKAARIYTDYNEANDDYLVTPQIELTGNQRLKFWTRAHSAGEPDEISVLLSTTTPTVGAFTNVLMASTPVNYVTYTEYEIDLSAYSGSCYIAFARNAAPADGWYLYVDDVTVEDIPAGPVFSISPTEWNFGSTLINSTSSKLFTITNAGVGTLTINTVAVSGDYFALAEPFVTANLGTGESATFTVNYNPSVVGTHTGTVTITDARAVSTVDLEGTCYDPTQPLPYTQDFNGGTSLTAINWAGDMYIATSHGTDGSNGLYRNLYSYVPSCNAITPPIGPMIANAQLKFDYRYVNWSGYPATATSLGASDNLQIQVSTDAGASYTTVYTIDQSNHVTSTSFANVRVSLAAYTTGSIMIRFLGTRGSGDYYLDIDNVIVQEAPAGAPNAVTLTYPANEATGLSKEGFNMTWTPDSAGGVPTYYVLYMSQDEETIYDDYSWETTATSFNPTLADENPVTFNYEDRWYWTVEAWNADGSALPDTPNWFDIMADPSVSLPYSQDFGTDATPVWPFGWTQNDGTQVWAVSATDNAAGIPNEMTATWTSYNGITRLISPPLVTTDIPAFAVNFKTYYDDYGTGVTAKIQYSHDLTTWYDTAWSAIGGGGNVTGLQTAMVTNPGNNPYTYVSWTLDGNHYQYDYWYVDDISITLPPDHDVSVVSYDVNIQVVPENTQVTPMATVMNNGINTETFDVTCVIGAGYTSTQTVTGLAMGQTQQLSFAPITPALNFAENVVITAALTDDSVAENNQVTDALICLPLDTPALANNAQTDQFVQFSLADPTTLTALPTAYTGSYFMSGADWMNGKWMGVEYDNGTLATDNYYEINPLTGVYLPSLGEPGAALMGIAWDDTNGIMYGAGSNGYLYTLDPLTGLAANGDSLWYNMPDTRAPVSFSSISGLMIDIAYDNANNILYGIDLGNDCLWTINPTTHEITPVGYFGIDINYAQDAAFDQVNGLLFLAGYSTFGGLYWIDTTSGAAYLVGNLGPNANEFDGFAIPYGTLAAAPEVSIAGTGTVSWTAIPGAIAYNVYSADDPYGTFTLEATVAATEYLGPTSAKKFYKVSAVGGRSVANHIQIRNNITNRNTGDLRTPKRFETGLANDFFHGIRNK